MQHTASECLTNDFSNVRNKHRSAEKFSFHQSGEPSDCIDTRIKFFGLVVVSRPNSSAFNLFFSDVKSEENISLLNNGRVA